MDPDSKTILILERDAQNVSGLEETLNQLNYRLKRSASLEEALQALSSEPYHLIVASLEAGGAELTRKAGKKKLPFICLSSALDAETKFSQHQSSGTPADAYFHWPVPIEDIVDSIERIIGLPPPPNGAGSRSVEAKPREESKDEEVGNLLNEIEALQEQVQFYQRQLDQVSVSSEKETHEMGEVLHDLQVDLDRTRKEKDQFKDEIQLLKTDLAARDKALRDRETSVVENKKEAVRQTEELQRDLEEARRTAEDSAEKHRRAQTALRDYYKAKLAKLTETEKRVSFLEGERERLVTENKQAQDKLSVADEDAKKLRAELDKERERGRKAKEALANITKALE